MAKRLNVSKSKYSESFTIIDDYYNHDTKKSTTFIAERLGNLKSLMEKYNTLSPILEHRTFLNLPAMPTPSASGRSQSLNRS